MSTAISHTQTATILPKSAAILQAKDDKPKLQRTSSIDTIKRINTYICSPQSYLLPAILTTWLKTKHNGLQSATEKTIFMFRSVIFGSFIVKYLLRRAKTSRSGGQMTKVDLQKALLDLVLTSIEQIITYIRGKIVVSIIFYLAMVYMTAQTALCLYLLTNTIIPVGLSFLLVSMTCIAILGHSLNRFSCRKRDVKSRKIE